MSQVKLILGVLGTPPESLMKSSQNDILKRIIKSKGGFQIIMRFSFLLSYNFEF